jgi:uncharacterized protein (DUF885 family)
MRGIIVSLSLLALTFPALAQPGAEAQLTGLLARFDTLEREVDPITASQEGDRDALKRWPEVTPAAQARYQAQWRTMRADAAAISEAALNVEARLNRRLFLYTLDDRIAAAAFDRDRMPFSNDSAFPSTADYVARTLPIRTEADAQAWLARLEALPKFYADNLANARRGLKDGFVQPRVVSRRTLEVLKALAPDAAAPEKSVLFKPLVMLPATIPAPRQEALRQQARALIADKIAPAHAAVIAFFEKDYLPKARASLAARDLPNGPAYYAYLARMHTTTPLTPDQIHQIGLDEVKRIRARMDETIKAAGFKGSFADFQKFLRTDPQFYAKNKEELLEKASRMAKRADDAMPGLFATLPRLPYGVRAVPRRDRRGQLHHRPL